MERNRTYRIGLLVAPLLPAFVLSYGATGTYATFGSVIGYAFLFYIPCLLGTLLAALPLYYLLKRINLIRWWSASLCGFVGGAVIFVAPAGTRAFKLNTIRSDWEELLLFSFLGGATAFLLWVFWSRGAAQQNATTDRAERRRSG